MKVITFNNLKGGDGKTNGATHCAKYLSQFGRTLLIDGDSQANASQRFSSHYRDENLLTNIFRKQAVTPLTVAENLDVIAGSPSLRDVESELYSKNNKELLFRNWLKRNHLEKHYEYMVIDTHNDTGNITTNLFLASDIIIGVASPSADSFKALLNLENYIEELREDFIDFNTGESNVTAQLYFLGNKVEHNTASSREFKEVILKNEKKQWLGYLEKREIFNEAALKGTTIFQLLDEKKYQDHRFKQFAQRTLAVFETIYEKLIEVA